MRILVVEDDEAIAATLTSILSHQHYAVEVAGDGEAGWELAQAYTYDLLLLDVVLPKLDGISLCRRLRSHHSSTPILLLTGRDSGHDKAIGLDAGADDYVVKPFDAEELVARVRALLRRGGATVTPTLEWGSLTLDPTTCTATYAGQPLSLTSKEYALLELFLRNPRRVFSCSAILDHLWSYETTPGEEAVRTHIKCLRQKLKAIAAPANLIDTVYGIGYRLQPLESLPEPTPPTAAPPASTSQAPTLAAIAQVWERFKEKIMAQVAVIAQLAQIAEVNHPLPEELKQQAQREAHTLAGSLGTFGLTEGSRLARNIEQLLQKQSTLKPKALKQLQAWAADLHQEIMGAADGGKQASIPPDQRPLLLIVDGDRDRTAALTQAAQARGLRTQIAADLALARTELQRDRPRVVLLDPSVAATTDQGLELLTELTHQTPPIPGLIFTAADDLALRLAVARQGGRAFLHKSLPDDQVLEAVTQVLHAADRIAAKVLAVDDDPVTLSQLETLLTPWGLQVMTLSDPREFWQTLESFGPDLLILDVQMPYLNGVDLCQVVRNDGRWNGLPILFLTAHTEADVMNQVFATGADDFVGKPIVGSELATRILNRLDRPQLLCHLSEPEESHGRPG